MITPEFVQTMAAYNRWQNQSAYTAAAQLDAEALALDRGAFFGSIQATLNHILWGDQIWMARFTDSPEPKAATIPESVSQYPGFSELRDARSDFDEQIVSWAGSVDPHWLTSDLTWYSGAMGGECTRPVSMLVVHMFNHQTHHRGQVNAMLTACGLALADTDLPFAPWA